jgi:hypothetical protein
VDHHESADSVIAPEHLGDAAQRDRRPPSVAHASRGDLIHRDDGLAAPLKFAYRIP